MIVVDDDHVDVTSDDKVGAATRIPRPIDPLTCRELAELDVLGEYRAFFGIQ